MKPGVSLIEVVIGILLSSMLATLLFVSFSQLQIASRITESFIEVDMRSAVVVRQMSRDISGAFVPQLALIETSTTQKAAAQDQQKSVTPLDKSTVFKVQHKDKNLDILTCVTNNPVMMYDTARPRIARVVYRLVADKKREGAFRLVRQELAELSLKDSEKTGAQEVRGFELAHNIKSCTASCTLLEYPEPKQEQKTDQQKAEQKQEQKVPEVIPTARTLENWMYDPQKAKEQKMPLLPYAITLKCVFWDDEHRREWPVEFSIPIAAFEPYREKKKEVKKVEQQPPKTVVDEKQKPEVVLQQAHKNNKNENNKIVQLQVPDNIAKFLEKQKGL